MLNFGIRKLLIAMFNARFVCMLGRLVWSDDIPHSLSTGKISEDVSREDKIPQLVGGKKKGLALSTTRLP